MSQKAALVVYFPVKPHVYKFLQKKVGEKLIVSKNDFFGSTVLDVLSKGYSDFEAVSGDLTFPAEISIRYLEKMGFHLDTRTIKKFNSRVDDLFREEMRMHVEVCLIAHNLPKEQSLRNFLSYYNIDEDDIKFETLVKDLTRNVKKIDAVRLD